MGRAYRIGLMVLVSAAFGAGMFFAGRQTAPTTSKTAPTTTAAPTTTTSAPTTTVVSATCQPSQLTIVQSGGGAAAGTNERTFSLTNTSSTTCTLYGYPGMLLLGSTNAAEPTDVVRGGGLAFENIGPSTVMLASGATAYFNVGYSDVTPPCSTASSVEITPPNDTAYAVVVLPLAIMACDNGTLHVSAVFSSTNAAATQTTAP